MLSACKPKKLFLQSNEVCCNQHKWETLLASHLTTSTTQCIVIQPGLGYKFFQDRINYTFSCINRLERAYVNIGMTSRAPSRQLPWSFTKPMRTGVRIPVPNTNVATYRWPGEHKQLRHLQTQMVEIKLAAAVSHMLSHPTSALPDPASPHSITTTPPAHPPYQVQEFKRLLVQLAVGLSYLLLSGTECSTVWRHSC